MSTKQEASGTVTDNSVSVSYANTITAEAGVSVGDDHAGAAVDVNFKTGTEAAVSAGLDGNNAYISAEYSDTTEAHLTADGHVSRAGFGVAAGVDAYATSGTTAEASASAGQNGVAVGASASVGTAVGVSASGTESFREGSASGAAGVSVGEHFEAGGSVSATYDHGKATVAVSGDLAAYLGVEADVSVTINTGQIQKDAKTAAHTIVDTGKQVGNTVKKETNKIGRAIKRGLHL